MKKFLIAAGVVTLAFAAVTSAATFNVNLTVGSTGADVVALQTALIAAGYDIPAISSGAVAKGYFGSQTQAAVKLYQAAKGIPNTGFVGPLTRAALNGGSTVVTTPVACPVGFVCTPVGGSTTGTVSNVGAEGTITLTASNSGIASSIYEGDTMVKVLGLKLEAKSSNINVQRVKINLGNSSAIYNKILSKIYVLDGSTVVASADLNSSTVVKEGTEYFITLSGMNVVVAKDATKVLTVAVDVKDSIDSTDRNVTRTVQTASNQAVRGVDGAGLDQYTGSVSVSKSFTIANSLADAASLKFSINSSSPDSDTIIASEGAEQNETDQETALIFNVKAEKDSVLINSLTVNATGTAVADGSITTVYLFDGSEEIDNASVATSTGVAEFANVDLTIAKDTTKVLTVKVDVRSASSTARTLTVSVDGSGTATVDAENSVGDALADAYLSGSATGEQMQVQKAGAVYALVSTPTLTKTAIGNTASSTYLATFKFTIAAEGTDVSVASTSAFVVGIYSNTGVLLASSTAGYEKPTSGVTQSGVGPYVIADGSSATFTVEKSWTAPEGVYTAGTIATARIMSATTDAGTVTYISDTFRTNSQSF
jgi:hypothetical protein